MKKNETILELDRAIASLQKAMHDELKQASLDPKVVQANPGMSDMVNSSPGDISARYWLMEFLKPLNRKEIESIANGFLVQLLNEEQAKKLVKFLLIRFPQYYKDIEVGRVAAGSVVSCFYAAMPPTKHTWPSNFCPAE